MRVAPGVTGRIGSFLLRRSTTNKTIRQTHATGPQYHKRKHFPAFQRAARTRAGHQHPSRHSSSAATHQPAYHQLHRRGEHPQHIVASPTHQAEWARFTTSAGEVRHRPLYDFTFGYQPPDLAPEAIYARVTAAKSARSSSSLSASQRYALEEAADDEAHYGASSAGVSLIAPSSSSGHTSGTTTDRLYGRGGPGGGRSVDPFRRKVGKVGRVDDVLYAWEKRGALQLFQVGKANNGKTKQVFPCFYCGYPVRSALVAIHRDNWDYRMCYSCYQKVIRNGLEEHL